MTAACHTARDALTATDHLTDSLDDLLIERVLFFPDKHIEIHYTIPDIFGL